ncbi:MAG: anti-sigma factor family protein [Acidimicrobiia bacterium]
MTSWDASGIGPHLEEALSAWLDDELAPAARRESARHLERCPLCQEELELVTTARMAVRALPVRLPPPDFLQDLIAPVTVLRPRRRLAWALAAAAASAAAVFLPQEPTVVPVLPSLVESHATRASVTGDPFSHLAPIAIPASLER